jgi:ribonuclease-3
LEKKRSKELAILQKELGLALPDPALLDTALTHLTFAFENKQRVQEHNQRLEFLGDVVLGLIVAEYLYCTCPEKQEGDLTKMRAAVVCEATLSKKARELNLGAYLLLGRGEELSGGRERVSILADTFEAVIGAIYLGAGLEQARKFVLKQLDKEIHLSIEGNYFDYKTILQELVQKNFEENVAYTILKESGPDHDKRFVAGVTFRERVMATGEGKSKKEAEQVAAQRLLQKIEEKKDLTILN